MTTLAPPPTAPPAGPAPAHRPPPPRVRIRPRDFRPPDVAILVLAIASAFSLVWIVFTQLTYLSGVFGFIVCWVVSFLVVYWGANALIFDRRLAADRLMAALVTLGALCLIIPLVLVSSYVVIKGVHFLSFYVLTHTQKGVLEVCVKGFKCVQPGLAHALVGTIEQVALAAAMGVPAAVLTAIFLNEVGGRFTNSVRVVVTAMSGLPAIVAGVFIYSMWIESFGFGYSGLAGALALAVLLLPTVTRGTEEVLRIVPDSLREASTALAAPEWRTVWSVVMPTARSGMITATLLGIAVAIGETAPLLLTIFGANVMNWDVFYGKQSALPLLAYQEIRSSLLRDVNFGYTCALVLFILVFAVFILARILGSNWLAAKIRREGKGARGGTMDQLEREMSDAAARGAAYSPRP